MLVVQCWIVFVAAPFASMGYAGSRATLELAFLGFGFLASDLALRGGQPRALASFSQWSCRESNPTVYQGFCRLNCCFATFRSRSVPLVTCGFAVGS